VEICKLTGKLPSELEGISQEEEIYMAYAIGKAYERWSKI
jgi:hypothetical protein